MRIPNLLLLASVALLGAGGCDRPPTAPFQELAPDTVRSLAVTGGYGCVVDGEGKVHCWEARRNGWLTAPLSVQSEQRFRAVLAPEDGRCGLTEGDRVLCFRFWGEPLEPSGGGLRFRMVDATREAFCGIAVDGETYCWGRLQTGSDNPHVAGTDYAVAPRRVPGAPRFVEIGVSDRHGCGLTAQGAAYCWGSNVAGQLGTDAADGCWYERGETAPCSLSAVPVAGALRFRALAVPGGRAYHTCGLGLEGSLYCWGGLDFQRANYGRIPTRVMPEKRFVRIATGGAQVCGTTAAGETYCVGRGVLGDGTFTFDFHGPALVAGGRRFVKLELAGSMSCGVDDRGETWCWGYSPFTVGAGCCNQLTPALVVMPGRATATATASRTPAPRHPAGPGGRRTPA